MNYLDRFSIAWDAPVIPSKELAGIPLGIAIEEFECVLSQYLIDAEKCLYQFDGAPVLVLEKGFDSNGDGGYGFSVYNKKLTNWRLYFSTPDHAGADPRALNVIVRSWKVYAVKAWMFENLKEGSRPVNSYRGKLCGGIGLGDLVRDLLAYTELEFDNAEEWFYTDKNFGGLEVSGYGVDLNDEPDQMIMALTVIEESPFTPAPPQDSEFDFLL